MFNHGVSELEGLEKPFSTYSPLTGQMGKLSLRKFQLCEENSPPISPFPNRKLGGLLQEERANPSQKNRLPQLSTTHIPHRQSLISY